MKDGWKHILDPEYEPSEDMPEIDNSGYRREAVLSLEKKDHNLTWHVQSTDEVNEFLGESDAFFIEGAKSLYGSGDEYTADELYVVGDLPRTGNEVYVLASETGSMEWNEDAGIPIDEEAGEIRLDQWDHSEDHTRHPNGGTIQISSEELYVHSKADEDNMATNNDPWSAGK